MSKIDQSKSVAGVVISWLASLMTVRMLCCDEDGYCYMLSQPLFVVQTEGRIRDSADWLFKCIAEAYTVLTNPDTRQQLDLDLARQDRRSSASMPQRARTGSYRSAPMHR